jgi:hypothetical protein
MPIPEIVQNKINSLKSNLEVRYPPYNLKRLSIGYASSQDAYNDTTINSYIYSNNLTDFTTGDIAYTDKTLSTTFSGGELWYHIFSEIQDDLGYAAQIDASGNILDIYSGATVYSIKLSPPVDNSPGACSRIPTDTTYYTNDDTFQIGSIIYTDPDLTTPFFGANQYYSVYDESKTPYGIAIQIDRNGVILINNNCK